MKVELMSQAERDILAQYGFKRETWLGETTYRYVQRSHGGEGIARLIIQKTNDPLASGFLVTMPARGQFPASYDEPDYRPLPAILACLALEGLL